MPMAFDIPTATEKEERKKPQKNATWSRYQLVMNCTWKGRQNMKEIWILKYEELKLCKIYPK